MQVQTVLGTVAPDQLGICLAHEHILIDLQCLFAPAKAESRKYLEKEPVSIEMRDVLISDPYQSRDNLVLDDTKLAAEELKRFAELGGGTVIDLSTRNIGPYPKQLADIARDTGLNIIASTGFYVERAHPRWIADAPVEQIEEFMLNEIYNGIGGTDIKPGVIGEIGTSNPITPNEAKVLSAAARAQRKTGLPLNVHLPIFGREGNNILNFLDNEGIDFSRVVLSHLDEINDVAYVKELAQRGCYVEFDTFGSEFAYSERGEREPTDWQRLDDLLELLEAGFEKQILLSQDICNKIHLTKYGGYGYAHILRGIVPRLSAHGISTSTIETMLVENPATMLSVASHARKAPGNHERMSM